MKILSLCRYVLIGSFIFFVYIISRTITAGNSQLLSVINAEILVAVLLVNILYLIKK